jgi:hypothetical protein
VLGTAALVAPVKKQQLELSQTENGDDEKEYRVNTRYDNGQSVHVYCEMVDEKAFRSVFVNNNTFAVKYF